MTGVQTCALPISFAPGVEITSFSARYESVFRPSQSGDVVFRFQLDGAVTLIIDGEQVAEKVYVKNPTNLYTLQAKAGKEYKVEILFTQRNEGATLDFDMGKEMEVNLDKAVEKVKDADVVLFAGGISPSLEGEEMPVAVPGFKGGDRTDIELPAVQRNLLKALKKAGKKVVFINYSGSAIGLVPETTTCEAILQAWYPGQAGGTAIVDALWGEYNPGGRLPVTFYKDVNQLPDFEDYSMKGRTYRYMQQQPLFPFGHGLSYTTFTYGEANLSKHTIGNGETVTLTVPVSNVGQRDGDEVVQVYLRSPADKDGPRYTLRAFKRVHIPAGQTQSVTIPLTHESFEWFDEATNTMHPVAGTYELLYGGSSDENQLKAIVMDVQ